MPIANNSSTYALIIVSLGILGVIVSFLVTDKKKNTIALALSVLVVGMGLFQFASSSVRQWRMSRRISKLQETQRLNLEALQSRLRDATEKARKSPGSTPVAAPAPAPSPAPAPASSNKRK